MTTKPTVAVLGTGIMGGAMARNIAAAGLPVRVWNRSREKADLLEDVAQVAGSVLEAVHGADVVLTMLWDTAAVAGAMEEARSHLAERTVWLQQSTVGIEGSARLASLAE
ncbi:MAG: NAD(P)-binding domain-containing protein, partial [Pseudonocardiales bacterium]